ncbi:MAG: FAD-dependent oxidoreductase [Ruminococcaceae bacterium]|nr:FAD-dependent oxidoreductase [Oscillospiraceae bacterium]
MNSIFIEAESLENRGGWIVDTASAEVIHSAYMMAHGMGIPVEDAYGKIDIPDDGDYYVWGLTRDWTAVWKVADPLGKFEIWIDGEPLPEILGTVGKDWAWQLAGRVRLSKGSHRLALHDLTGFNGRCDAILITDSDDIPKSDTESIDAIRRSLSYKEIATEDVTYDLVVVGGGIAGICTALAAMRSGVSVALIHDRAVLGGCNSSEVRVSMGGIINLPPYPNLGNVVRSIAPIVGYPTVYCKEAFEDDRKRLAFTVRERRPAMHKLFLEEIATDVESEGGNIAAVITTNALTGKKTRIRGRLFSDCSGDGILARMSGCEIMYGREARSEFGESLAPSEHQSLVMGHSIRWYSEDTGAPVDFPELDLGLAFTDESCLDCASGDWEQESGFTKDMVKDIEYIRDFGLRAIYANWSFQKHRFKNKDKYKNLALRWVSPIGGKREGYRVKGDYILTQNDIEEKRVHPDATACLTWSIDMHFPEPTNLAEFGEAFRSFAYHRGIEKPYPVPYRCLYSKDVGNLFLGGRLVSTSHVAFSSVRVMRTLGELGEAVGIASGVCKRHGCLPREVYTEYLDELRAKLTEGIRIPDAFECAVEDEEAYHFKDIGWWYLNTGKSDSPENTEKFKRGVEALGLEHKYPMPKKWEQN